MDVSLSLPQERILVVYKAFLEMIPNVLLDPGDQYYVCYTTILCL